MRTKIGIINVTGYAGSEIARILHNHPDVEISSITGRSSVGKKIGEVYPHLSDINLNISEYIKNQNNYANELFSKNKIDFIL